MASWTSLKNILGKGDWLLVIYRWGYETKFCYELINTKDFYHRFFIEDIPGQIYDFEVHKDRLDLELCEEQDDRILWQHVQAYLFYFFYCFSLRIAKRRKSSI